MADLNPGTTIKGLYGLKVGRARPGSHDHRHQLPDCYPGL